MEQVTFASQPTGLYILNGQAVFIQNSVQNDDISGAESSDIVQQALNGLNCTITSPGNHSEIRPNDNKSNGQKFVLPDKDKSDDGRVVQLSISDDFSLPFLSASMKGDSGNGTSDSTLLDNIFNAENDKCESSSSSDALTNFLKLSSKDDLNNQFELVSPLRGNFTYAYQLSDGTKICPVTNLESATNNVNIQEIPSKPNNMLIDDVSVPSKIAVPQAQPVQGNRKLVYVNKIVGNSLKPRIILNMKSKTAQEQQKRVSHKIQVVPSNGKSVFINSPRNSTSQKMIAATIGALPVNDIANGQKLVLCKDMKTKKPGASVLLSTLLKNQPTELRQVDVNTSQSEPAVMNSVESTQQSLLQQQLLLQNNTQAITAPSLMKKDQVKNETKPIGRLTESQLKKIAAVFQNSCRNRTKLTNSTIFDTETNTRIVCRVVYPEDLIKEGEKRVVKRGKKRSRPGEVAKKPQGEDEKTKKPPPPSARTRSGRLSRPPRYMVKDFKKLTEDSEASYSDYRSDSDENSENTPFLHLPRPQQRKISSKFHCPKCGKVYLGKRKMLKHFSENPDHKDSKTIFELEEDDHDNAKQQENERAMWKRIFRRGARKPKLDSAALLKELFSACSDEHFIPMVKERVASKVDPWDFLKTRHAKEEGGVRSLLADLSSLMKSIPSNLVQAAQPEDVGAFCIEDENLCKVLNISPGYYLPNESALKDADEIKDTNDVGNATCNTEENGHQPPETCWDTGSSNMCNEDQTKMEIEHPKIDMVDEASKEDSSELNEILSKSSLESFDQIVSERLDDLIPSSPLDVSSLVEAQVLARSLLSSSPDLLHGVSGSTEDLMKTLENLTPDLPTDSASADFDFEVLSSDFTSDR